MRLHALLAVVSLPAGGAVAAAQGLPDGAPLVLAQPSPPQQAAPQPPLTITIAPQPDESPGNPAQPAPRRPSRIATSFPMPIKQHDASLYTMKIVPHDTGPYAIRIAPSAPRRETSAQPRMLPAPPSPPDLEPLP